MVILKSNFVILLCCLNNPLADDITAIAWHPSSRYLATAGGGDRQIRVWHNAAGIRVQIEDLQGRIFRSRNENVKVRTQVMKVEGLLFRIVPWLYFITIHNLPLPSVGSITQIEKQATAYSRK